MSIPNLESFSKLLQLSVSPVVMISGVGLLLLSVTNRLGRAIDRARSLSKELDSGIASTAHEGKAQLEIIVRRAEFLRLSVSLIVASVFFSCLMILFLFVMSFSGVNLEIGVLALFVLSLLSTLSSVIYLLADVYLSLKALRLDVSRHLE